MQIEAAHVVNLAHQTERTAERWVELRAERWVELRAELLGE